MSAAAMTRGRVRRVQIGAQRYYASQEELAAIHNPAFAARRYLRASIAWNDWELGFLTSLADRPRWAGALTARQENAMRSIARRYVTEGAR